jgi:hypothetical protein
LRDKRELTRKNQEGFSVIRAIPGPENPEAKKVHQSLITVHVKKLQ